MIVTESCSHATTPRDFSKRRYHICNDKELVNPIGKFCHRRCVKYKIFRKHVSENCKVWDVDILDMTNRDDYLKARNANFILINESEIDKT